MGLVKVAFKYFVVIFIVGFLFQCKSTSVSTLSNKSVLEDTLSEKDLFNFKYQFFEANKYLLEGNLEYAVKFFTECIEIDPSSAVSHYRLASIFVQTKDYELALKHAEIAANLNNKNRWYLYLVGNLYTHNSKFEQAITTFNTLINQYPKELDFYLSLGDVYLKKSDIKGALKVYSRVENIFGISEMISLQKHKLYIALKDKKGALNSLNVLSQKFPQNSDYKRMIAEFYYSTNSIDEAIDQYNLILDFKPDDGLSLIGLADCYAVLKDYGKVEEHLVLAYESKELESDIKFNVLLKIYQGSEHNKQLYDIAYKLSTVLIKDYPNDSDIATIHTNFLLQDKKLKEARKLLTNVVIKRKDKYALWEQLIWLDNEFSSWDTLFIHSSEAIKYFPNQSFLYFFNGFSAFQIGKYQKAVNSLSFGNKLVTAKDPMKMDFLTFLAESYFKLGSKNETYLLYDEILSIEPKNIMVLNNYAYYLSEDSIKLDKAEKMSRITIETEPENATYLDTYAWILFKKNKLPEALNYIQKAVDNSDNISDVVLEHYGDILFFNDKKIKAINAWKAALEIGEGSGLLKEKVANETYIK